MKFFDELAVTELVAGARTREVCREQQPGAVWVASWPTPTRPVSSAPVTMIVALEGFEAGGIEFDHCQRLPKGPYSLFRRKPQSGRYLPLYCCYW